MKICSVEGCEKPGKARSWCSMHYQRWQKFGDPTLGPPPAPIRYNTPEESFAARTEWRGECLVWTGGATTVGYGAISVQGKPTPAHRYAWERVNGPIPKGLFVDHKCHNRLCTNVIHLRIVTQKQNMENLSGLVASNTSGYRNVYWDIRVRKWKVQVLHEGKSHYGGHYATLEEANEFAVTLRNRLFTHNDTDRVLK